MKKKAMIVLNAYYHIFCTHNNKYHEWINFQNQMPNLYYMKTFWKWLIFALYIVKKYAVEIGINHFCIHNWQQIIQTSCPAGRVSLRGLNHHVDVITDLRNNGHFCGARALCMDTDARRWQAERPEAGGGAVKFDLHGAIVQNVERATTWEQPAYHKLKMVEMQNVKTEHSLAALFPTVFKLQTLWIAMCVGRPTHIMIHSQNIGKNLNPPKSWR